MLRCLTSKLGHVKSKSLKYRLIKGSPELKIVSSLELSNDVGEGKRESSIATKVLTAGRSHHSRHTSIETCERETHLHVRMHIHRKPLAANVFFKYYLLLFFKVVRYSFPQSEAIHTQIAPKMKNEYFFTKFCKKPTVCMP